MPADLRAKVQQSADRATLVNAWHYFNYIGTLLYFTADCGDALGRNTSPDVASATDQRLKELKNRIVREEEAEKSIKVTRMVVHVSKRVYLVELVAKYIEETEARKAEPKKRRKKNLRRLSPKDRFTDLLFPETIKDQGEQVSKEKGRQVGKKEKSPRDKAKEQLDYWIRLGEPLVRMVQRFGHGILLLLSEKLTDKE